MQCKEGRGDCVHQPSPGWQRSQLTAHSVPAFLLSDPVKSFLAAQHGTHTGKQHKMSSVPLSTRSQVRSGSCPYGPALSSTLEEASRVQLSSVISTVSTPLSKHTVVSTHCITWRKKDAFVAASIGVHPYCVSFTLMSQWYHCLLPVK